jgi:hypothetical protein
LAIYPVGEEEEEAHMASQPEIPKPDTIDPQSPPETPPAERPGETPFQEPPEVMPVGPDVDNPDRGPEELPGVPD